MAALPFRFNCESQPEILVLTSRQTKRFIIPRGWPKKGSAEPLTVAREAFEEASFKGKIGKGPIGSYSYWKRLERFFELVKVRVYRTHPRKAA